MSDRDNKPCVGDQSFQGLLSAQGSEQSLGMPGDVPRGGIAADQLAEKGVLAQRHRLRIQQLLKRALHRLTLRDLLVDAVVGELLLDAGRQADGNRHGAIVLQIVKLVIHGGRPLPGRSKTEQRNRAPILKTGVQLIDVRTFAPLEGPSSSDKEIQAVVFRD